MTEKFVQLEQSEALWTVDNGVHDTIDSLLAPYNDSPVARKRVNDDDRLVADTILQTVVSHLEQQNPDKPVAFSDVSGFLSDTYARVRDTQKRGEGYENVNLAHLRNMMSSVRGKYLYGDTLESEPVFTPVPEKKRFRFPKKLVASAAAIAFGLSTLFGKDQTPTDAHIAHVPQNPAAYETSTRIQAPQVAEAPQMQEIAGGFDEFPTGETAHVTFFLPDENGNIVEIDGGDMVFGKDTARLDVPKGTAPQPEAINEYARLSYSQEKNGINRNLDMAHPKQDVGKGIEIGPFEVPRSWMAAGKSINGGHAKFDFTKSGRIFETYYGEPIYYDKSANDSSDAIAYDERVTTDGVVICAEFMVDIPELQLLGPTTEVAFIPYTKQVSYKPVDNLKSHQEVYAGVIFPVRSDKFN